MSIPRRVSLLVLTPHEALAFPNQVRPASWRERKTCPAAEKRTVRPTTSRIQIQRDSVPIPAFDCGIFAEARARRAELPASYHVAVGGTVEESQKSQASVFAVVPLMLFAMITFLMIQLQSFNRLLLVLSVVPLGMIGIVAALLIVAYGAMRGSRQVH